MEPLHAHFTFPVDSAGMARQPKSRVSPNKNPRKRSGPGTEMVKGTGGRDKINGTQNPDQPLTEKQRLFVNAYARDGMNGLAAMRIAGLAGQPNTQLNNPKIQKAIAIEREKFAKASAMTKKKVIDGLLEAIDMAKIQADPTPMIQGWTQIAKMCGFMEPTRHKLEVTVQGQVVIQKLQQLDDDQLLALADGHSDALEGEFTVVNE